MSKNKVNDRNNDKKWGGTRKAADHLDTTCSSIRNRVARGQLPYRKLGGRLMFDLDELDQLLENGPGRKLDEVTQ
jgi:hypothetical protein